MGDGSVRGCSEQTRCVRAVKTFSSGKSATENSRKITCLKSTLEKVDITDCLRKGTSLIVCGNTGKPQMM